MDSRVSFGAIPSADIVVLVVAFTLAVTPVACAAEVRIAARFATFN
jgi:hypothetical protein